ncbi:hypothetical protein [Sphingomonas aracearum]|nr:hypothetical protein [Sphingomonas aracearum]
MVPTPRDSDRLAGALRRAFGGSDVLGEDWQRLLARLDRCSSKAARL